MPLNPLIDHSPYYIQGKQQFWFGGDMEEHDYDPGSTKEAEWIEGWRAAEKIKGEYDDRINKE